MVIAGYLYVVNVGREQMRYGRGQSVDTHIGVQRTGRYNHVSAKGNDIVIAGHSVNVIERGRRERQRLAAEQVDVQRLVDPHFVTI